MPVTINGSTGISGIDGSTGTPAIIGSDADTGLVFAAGQVTASLNGTAANVALVSGTSQASTSGTSIDFTGIPSWVKRITVMFNGVSTNGTSPVIIQLGTGATPTYTATGYLGSVASINFNTGFALDDIANAAGVRHGAGSILLLNPSTFVYSFFGCGGRSDTSGTQYAAGGSISLGAVVTAVRITTVGGTNTFDAGSINIMWE